MNSSTGSASVMSAVPLADLRQRRRSTSTPHFRYVFSDLPVAQPSPLAVSVAREVEYVPRVRRIGAAWLRHTARMPEDRVEMALVVLSELVTNAVVHGAGHSVGFRCWSPQPGLLRFEIDDETESGEPLPQEASPLAESGRGLFLVDSLVDELGGDWGYTNGGATAWCRLPIQDDRPSCGRGQS
ncbi:ATP-binding protein [Streptomyces sp. NPDC001939]